MDCPYIIEPIASGWRVCRVNPDNGALDGPEAVVHRHRDVARAYADTATALERYLASLDRQEDSAELFEAWRRFDDEYEMLTMLLKDAPTHVIANVSAGWAPMSQTRH